MPEMRFMLVSRNDESKKSEGKLGLMTAVWKPGIGTIRMSRPPQQLINVSRMGVHEAMQFRGQSYSQDRPWHADNYAWTRSRVSRHMSSAAASTLQNQGIAEL